MDLGIASKPKAQNPEQHFQENFFFEFQVADHQISTRALELYANSLKQLATFIIAAPMKNVEKCSCQFVDRKVLWV